MWKTKGRDINIEMLREALSESKGALSHTHLAPEKHESHSFSSVISEVVPKVSACSHSSIKFTSSLENGVPEMDGGYSLPQLEQQKLLFKGR